MKLLNYLAIASILFSVLQACKKKEAPISVPTLKTYEVTNILPLTAQCSGQITSTGGGTLSEFGICWSTGEDPKISDSKFVCSDTAHISATITGIENNTKYYVRAYASNDAGVGYGNVVSFLANKVSDTEGHIYTSIAIGSQVWLVENLRATKYRNGENIAHSTDTTEWRTAKGGMFCNYQDDATLAASLGCLYNWAAVNDTRGITPIAWHVPSKAEWETLIDFLGGKDVAAGAMKKIGLTDWDQPNVGATNSSGFNALPAGYYYFYESTWEGRGYMSYWWSATEQNFENAYSFNIGNSAARIMTDNPTKTAGFSVRCIKN